MDPTLPSSGVQANPVHHDAPRLTPPDGGRIIAGKYQLLEPIGRGGRGEVHRALQIGVAREVAVKLLTDVREEVARSRFLHEARIAAQIRHPCVVTIFDAGVDGDGTPYCVMELLEGETLAAHIARVGRLAPLAAVEIAAGIAGALQAVHDKGFLHRDVKPGNIFLAHREDGGTDPKLLDFGIAQRLAVEAEVIRRITRRSLVNVAPARPHDPDRPAVIVGTPRYLAPEQILGGKLDARTDVYALGATLYEALTGTAPFQAQSTTDLLAKVLSEEPAPLARRAPDAEVPAPLDGEVIRALSKDASARQEGASALAAALWAALAAARHSEISEPAPPLPVHRSPLPWIVAAVLAAAIALLFVAYFRKPPEPPKLPAVAVVATATAAPAPPVTDVPAVAPIREAAAPTESARPEPAPKGARKPAPPRASSAPSAAPTATDMKIDDLKVPY